MSDPIQQVREKNEAAGETESLLQCDLTKTTASSSEIPVIYSYQTKRRAVSLHVLGLLARDRQVRHIYLVSARKRATYKLTCGS